jgi:lipopolysaccharide/colanic/teichoic acid biosynthesis glycosyltransferase
MYSFEGDPRVTKLGKVLRQLSLDELPQILNIIRGEMSFVGPRPLIVGELDFQENLPGNLRERFYMRPGITGLAQVSGRNHISVHQKIFFDVIYINRFERLGLALDAYIMFKTFFIVLRRKGVTEISSQP